MRMVYFSQKYWTLKEEILHNNVYALDINVLQITIEKAERLMLRQKAKRMKRIIVFLANIQIKPGTNFTMDNIMAILLYCDFSELSFWFSSTFRRKHVHEMNKDLKARNREYWNWTVID